MSTFGHLVECLLLTDAISKGVLLTPTGGKLGHALMDSYTSNVFYCYICFFYGSLAETHQLYHVFCQSSWLATMGELGLVVVDV